MSYKDKSYSRSLHQQAYDKLTRMQAFGQSKREDKQQEVTDSKIYSYNTYVTYSKCVDRFVDYVKTNHPEITSLAKAEKYVPEFLESRIEKELSAWTIHTEASALNKLYGIQPGDKYYFDAPTRNRADIQRSRMDAVRDKHFSVSNNDELIKFAQGTGLRRSELEKLQGGDLMQRKDMEEKKEYLEAQRHLDAKQQHELSLLRDALAFDKANYYLDVIGKGGRERYSPIVGPNTTQIIERIESTPDNAKVWQHVHSNADIHGYRGDYATYIYRSYARDIKGIPYDRINSGSGKKYQSGIYVCRKDEAGKKLDKEAMLKASKALGHNRIEVVANNYIRGL